MNQDRILLSHGSGGKLMHELVDEIFRERFHNSILDEMSDSAILEQQGDSESELCFTTDSYVVNPIFFPGGNIGKLAVCGTVNDLSVEGAKPLFLSCAVIVEEGFEKKHLEKIADSMASTAREAGVKIVTGDFKVVDKGKADKIFINTAGIGIRRKSTSSHEKEIRPGDKILINGNIGEHSVAVLAARETFALETSVKSDCAPLNHLIEIALASGAEIKFMRDPTRGGAAATLNEVVEKRDFGIRLEEDEIPVSEETSAACEILGFDPLFMANEGKVILIANSEQADKLLSALKEHPLGRESRIIGEVVAENPGKVTMRTGIGGERIIEMPVGEQLPRIC